MLVKYSYLLSVHGVNSFILITQHHGISLSFEVIYLTTPEILTLNNPLLDIIFNVLDSAEFIFFFEKLRLISGSDIGIHGAVLTF